jgi:hypothetical protein
MMAMLRGFFSGSVPFTFLRRTVPRVATSRTTSSWSPRISVMLFCAPPQYTRSPRNTVERTRAGSSGAQLLNPTGG